MAKNSIDKNIESLCNRFQNQFRISMNELEINMDPSCTCIDENTECTLCFDDVEDNINVIISKTTKRSSVLTEVSSSKRQCFHEYLDLSIDSTERTNLENILASNMYQYTDDPKIKTELAQLKEKGLELIQRSTTKTSTPLGVPCLIGSTIETLQWIPVPAFVDDIDFLKRLGKRQLIWRKRDQDPGLCTRKYEWMDQMNDLFDKNLLYPVLNQNNIKKQITIVEVAFHNIRNNTSIERLKGLIGIAATTLCCKDPNKIKIIDYASVRPVKSKTTRSYGNFDKLISDDRNEAVIVYCNDKSSIASMYQSNVFPWSSRFKSIASKFYNVVSLVSFRGIIRNQIPCIDADIHDETKCCLQCNMTSTLLNLGSKKSNSSYRRTRRYLSQCNVFAKTSKNLPLMSGKTDDVYNYYNEYL